MKSCVGWRRFLILLPLVLIIPHLLSVVELHQNSNERLQSKRNKKFDHLVLGPAAGQGLSNRLQCQGTKALNGTHVSISQGSVNGVAEVSFVTVFTVYNTSLGGRAESSSSSLVTVGKASYTKTERSMAVLNVFINFVQMAMPQSNVVILTDPASDLSVERAKVTVQPIQGEYSRDKLMLQRIRSYITFLDMKLEVLSSSRSGTTHYIFTDSDIAVVDDLGHIFHKHQSFHIALTFRNNREQPLNSGFIAVRGSKEGILRGKLFLQEVLKAYTSKYMNASRMLGDQLALVWVVKSHPFLDTKKFTRPQAFQEVIGGTSVLFLPCSTYNWTPPEGAGQFHGMPLDVKVVHFKGSRKRLMLESWNFFNSTSNISDMLCLILKSGRTKYGLESYSFEMSDFSTGENPQFIGTSEECFQHFSWVWEVEMNS